MRLAPPPIEIGPLEGFENSDIFEAKHAGRRLAKVVADLKGHSVIVIDGAWGTGKSVFVQQWAGLLRQNGHPVVYFDAFAHDHLDDAFFPLFGSLLRATNKSERGVFDAAREKLMERAAQVIRAMPRVATDLALDAATAGVVRGSVIRRAMSAARSAIQKHTADRTTPSMVRARLKDTQDHLACVEEFRNAVATAVGEASDRDARSPLVFIVDELDRCRPEYALRVLERLKHVFAADGVCFVLVTHLAELEKMVAHAYGISDAAAYLNKFYHLPLNIDAILNQNADFARERYLAQLVRANGLEGASHHAKAVVDNLIRIHEASLRDIERIVLLWVLINRLFGSDLDFNSGEIRDCLAPGLIVMRHVKRELYSQAAAGTLEWSEAEKFLQLAQWDGDTEEPAKRMWRSFTVNGIESLSEEDRVEPDGWEWPRQSRPAMLARVCDKIDQVTDWISHE